MYFVYEQDRALGPLELVQYRFEALFEIAAIFGAGQERAHVQREDRAVGEDFGHLLLDDQLRQPLGDGRLADAGLADEQRIVLAPAAQDLNGALDLRTAADQGIDVPGQRLLVQIHGEGGERAARRLLAAFADLGIRVTGGRQTGALIADFGDAVGDEIDDVETRDVLLVQKINGMGILLSEDRHEHIGTAYLLFARALYMQDSALYDPLKSQTRLSLGVAVNRQRGYMLAKKLVELATQHIDVTAARPDHSRRGRVVEQRHQQVLHGNELVTLVARALNSLVQRCFEFLRNHHSGSIVHWSGWRCSRA